ncbi:glycoside hydrolase family 2 protein [Bacillales bacterium AN1005]
MQSFNPNTVRQTYNLNGTWQFCLAANDTGSLVSPSSGDPAWGEIQVPGSWEEQGYGEEPSYQRVDTWTKVREYEGTAWYTRNFEIASTEMDCAYILRLKGVRWTTSLWVNGQYAGERDSLVNVQEWDVTPWIREGSLNELKLRVDNTMKLPLAGSHIHSLHTATAWGGITGGATLECIPMNRINQLSLLPDAKQETLTIKGTINVAPNSTSSALRLQIEIRHPDGTWLDDQSFKVELRKHEDDERTEAIEADGQRIAEIQPLQLNLAQEQGLALWSDESPSLYQAMIRLYDGELQLDQQQRTFGVRSFQAHGQKLMLNDIPVFLRGYVDCCIFPLTGYPVWDKQHYIRQFQIAKSYGFNHVRLHGWSAPQPFWEAADEEGMLVQAELPHWSRLFENRERPAPAEVLTYLTHELKGLLTSLQDHPSFVLFSMGNELIGYNGHPELNELVRKAQALDPSRLYTDNTGFGQLPAQGREGDFYIQSLNWHPPLESELSAVPDTTLDYQAVTRLTDRPVIGHEHAQYTMYVRPEEREKYTGVLRPSWLPPIEESLTRKGIATDLEQFQRASGAHLVRSLKEAMERVRRTPNAAGIQLLDIRDFPGQGHATTGILDVFWDSKGIAEPVDFQQFNENTVLLLSCRERTFYAGEAIQVEARVSHYGQQPIKDAIVRWKLISNHVVLEDGHWHYGEVDRGVVLPLGYLTIHAPSENAVAFKLEAEIRSGDDKVIAANVWHGWSFPHYRTHEQTHRIWNSVTELQPHLLGAHQDHVDHLDGSTLRRGSQFNLVIAKSLTPNILDYLVNGGQVWVQTPPEGLYDPVETKYLPVFWNYLMFATQPGATMGLNLKEQTAMLGRFPYDHASDWQWYHLVNGTPAICLDTLRGVSPLIEVIDHFHRAKRLTYAFEARVGKGKLLVSSLPFTELSLMKRPEVAYLFQEIISYLLSDQFEPESAISVGELLGILKLQTIRFAL